MPNWVLRYNEIMNEHLQRCSVDWFDLETCQTGRTSVQLSSHKSFKRDFSILLRVCESCWWGNDPKYAQPQSLNDDCIYYGCFFFFSPPLSNEL